MRIFEEINNDWFYMSLHMFKKGIVGKQELMNDEYIFEVRDNGIIVLRFDNNEDYFKLFDIGEYDINLACSIFSNYYNDWELFDSYTASEDWNEGYILNYFNEENKELLNDILKYISPELDSNNPSDKSEISKKIELMFSKKVDYLVGDYSSNMNSAMLKGVEELIEDDLCEIFQENGLHKLSCFYKYITTVDNLIKLYDELNCKSDSLYEMLQKLGRTKDVSGDYSGSIYEVNYHDYFDDESFNRDIKRFLEDIFENIQDSDEFVDIIAYRDVLEKLKKFRFGQWFSLPKSKNRYPMIKITGIDPKTNLINIIYKKSEYGETKGSLSLEQFNNLLYHPELF